MVGAQGALYISYSRLWVSEGKQEEIVFFWRCISYLETLQTHLPTSKLYSSAELAPFFSSAGLFRSHKGGMVADWSLLKTSTVWNWLVLYATASISVYACYPLLAYQGITEHSPASAWIRDAYARTTCCDLWLLSWKDAEHFASVLPEEPGNPDAP